MAQSSLDISDLMAATECGATCASAGLAQRDLLRRAAAYPTLFPARPFDPAFFATIAAANAFCAPWLPADRLRVTNRMTLWVFGLDRLIDTVATEPDEVEDIVHRCLTTAKDGTAVGDALTGFLAEIRDELSGAPAFPALSAMWYDELRRMLAAMARDWRWKAARQADPDASLPTLEHYVNNSGFGFSMVYVSHWLAVAPAESIDDAPRLRAAGHAVERVIGLLNDLGTYDRDVATGDLNALMLDDRSVVEARITDETARSRALLAALAPASRDLALFLERHIHFNTGFYGVTDYQGEL
jgi:hypothetical protein